MSSSYGIGADGMLITFGIRDCYPNQRAKGPSAEILIRICTLSIDSGILIWIFSDTRVLL